MNVNDSDGRVIGHKKKKENHSNNNSNTHPQVSTELMKYLVKWKKWQLDDVLPVEELSLFLLWEAEKNQLDGKVAQG